MMYCKNIATTFFLFLTFSLQAATAADYPKRIVSLGPINTENVYLLGAEDRLVANTSYCVRPEAAREKEKIGSVMQVSIEKIIILKPDLVLATGLTQPQQLRKLQELGIRVVQVKQPASFSAICEDFLKLGRLLGLEERARQIVDGAKIKVEAIHRRVSVFPEKKVFLQVGSQPLFGSVRSSFTHDYIRLAGGSNILENQKTGTTGYEKVIVRNPDVIIIAIMGTESGVAAQEKEKWQRYSSISAVRKGHVHVINPDLVCSPSPATFAESLEIIAGLIHPESVRTQ
jgi:iron complex transport system substrate-binding protein